MAEPEIVHQIRSVLKLKTNEEIILGDGQSKEVIARIVKLTKSLILLAVTKEYFNQNEPAGQVTLFCSVLKKDNFEWVVQKTTEVGATKIVPIICERSIKTNLNINRLNKIVKEASEQSGRAIVPEVLEPISFERALAAATSNELNILFEGSGEDLESLGRLPSRIGVFIGPEGGFSPYEIDKAKTAGYWIANLGKLTLRGETAAIVGIFSIIRLI